jgi:hypothetical protein
MRYQEADSARTGRSLMKSSKEEFNLCHELTPHLVLKTATTKTTVVGDPFFAWQPFTL